MTLETLPSHIVDNTIFSVLYKGYSQSKSLKLRYTSDGKGILITGPKAFSQKKVDTFLKNSSLWLSLHKPLILTSYKFKNGTIFPFFGEDLTLQHHRVARKSILKDGNIFHVMSPSTDFKDQLHSWIKKESKLYFENICHKFALNMNVEFKSIHVSDPKTRWGSCSSHGKLSFSWRLAFAPLSVIRYVAIHELSHLIEMNHSAAFWKIVSTYDPNYQASRQWLKQSGRQLHQWQF